MSATPANSALAQQLTRDARLLTSSLSSLKEFAEALVSRAVASTPSSVASRVADIVQTSTSGAEKTAEARENEQRQRDEDVASAVEEWLQELHAENNLLRDIIDEFRCAVDMIMTKHRHQIQEMRDQQSLAEENFRVQLEEERVKNRWLESERDRLSQRISDLQDVIAVALTQKEDEEHEVETEIYQLHQENDMLRRLLDIHREKNADTYALSEVEEKIAASWPRRPKERRSSYVSSTVSEEEEEEEEEEEYDDDDDEEEEEEDGRGRMRARGGFGRFGLLEHTSDAHAQQNGTYHSNRTGSHSSGSGGGNGDASSPFFAFGSLGQNVEPHNVTQSHGLRTILDEDESDL